ncbi:MAG: type II RES/Xre toxin-antitoxin system antitoxin [Microcystaceae cyanobacterium]
MSDSQSVVKILGVENLLDEPLRQDKLPQTLAAIVRAGLPSSSAARLAEYYGISQTKVSQLLGVSVRTLERHQKDNRSLTPVQSDRLLRYARIAAHAEEVFENAETAKDWLKRPNSALGGEVPLDLLDTEAGVKQVDDVLTRIEYGVYS